MTFHDSRTRYYIQIGYGKDSALPFKSGLLLDYLHAFLRTWNRHAIPGHPWQELTHTYGGLVNGWLAGRLGFAGCAG